MDIIAAPSPRITEATMAVPFLLLTRPRAFFTPSLAAEKRFEVTSPFTPSTADWRERTEGEIVEGMGRP